MLVRCWRLGFEFIISIHKTFDFSEQALQTVIYFGAVVSLLYHFGIIQYILIRVAWAMQFTMGTTAAESLNAAACIFLGQVGS
jgi:nucleoside permease NupC